ncbi:hypothetical protein F2Q70_00005584 [Brassica cretica]|uniref:Uncharacterized protein n=1 Tax=Brassica cretica TaxID=69181 RepID=A0A8S9IYI5_BRACR|nr:hypothetical protein F2Q70_00005584 [Brassica cretica]
MHGGVRVTLGVCEWWCELEAASGYRSCSDGLRRWLNSSKGKATILQIHHKFSRSYHVYQHPPRRRSSVVRKALRGIQERNMMDLSWGLVNKPMHIIHLLCGFRGSKDSLY